ESNPIPVKWATTRMGLTGPTMRLPMTPLDEKYHDRVENALKKAGVL
ncbi:MAG: 4-hydroxy-tetrahydrodipicolinate synthase, partial [bacterium]|nr:4-hydroxy-tetrahydrodipicolinate synthase [bacterium]